MIVLDTNVISEFMRPSPDPGVVSWLDQQPAASVWTTSLCVFEIRIGLSMMDRGRRHDSLVARFQRVLEEDLGSRVLDFDAGAAIAAAEIVDRTRGRGVTVDLRDLLIAGTVAARRAELATRNTRHFEHTGIRLVNPWGSSR